MLTLVFLKLLADCGAFYMTVVCETLVGLVAKYRTISLHCVHVHLQHHCNVA